MKLNRLSHDFYNRPVVTVAKELLGKKLIFGHHEGIITETEAYASFDDEASHAFKITNRSKIMFGPPGKVYVYMIYGMYYCLNIVTQKEGEGSAVLIRGLKLPSIHLNGPGKLCRHLGIDKTFNGLDLVKSEEFYLIENKKPSNIVITTRIGINKATDKLWRFVLPL